MHGVLVRDQFWNPQIVNPTSLPLKRASIRCRQHLDGFIQHSIRQSYCASDLDIAAITDQADELFQLVLTNPYHVLSSLLPHETDQHYYLRARRHDRQLADKGNGLFSIIIL